MIGYFAATFVAVVTLMIATIVSAPYMHCQDEPALLSAQNNIHARGLTCEILYSGVS